MLVDVMERHSHLDLDPVIKAKRFHVSAAPIDRMLVNAHTYGWRKHREVASAAMSLRTFFD